MVFSEFEEQVHNCVKCKDQSFGYAVKYYPIISFGDPENKPIAVVGLNPSTREYEDKYVSDSASNKERHRSQLNYFKKKPYTFFKNLAKYFDNPVRSKLGWVRFPWEKVGYLDIVKCPVRAYPKAGSQWGSISPMERKAIISKCSPYLIIQLEQLEPKLVMAYGADVCRWFYPDYTPDNAFTVKQCKIPLTEQNLDVVLVPQTRGSHTVEVIEKVKKAIAENI
jgi:uracil-DNA glycosylase